LPSGLSQGHEAAPVVNGGYLFVRTPMEHSIVMDAATGKALWNYEYPLEKEA
jgi:alcohol dehydrogenase (cytochrome c)